MDSLSVYKKAYRRSLQRIAKRDYSSFEMENYLKKNFDLTSLELDSIMSKLKTSGLIDDERYLKMRVDSLYAQRRGNHRIIQDLKKRGYSEEDIYSVLWNHESSEYLEAALNRAQTFLNKQKTGSVRQRFDKMKSHMVRQGFEFEVIERISPYLNDDYGYEDEFVSLKKTMARVYPRYQRKYENNFERKQALVRYGMSRGYNYAMIDKVIKELENENY